MVDIMKDKDVYHCKECDKIIDTSETEVPPQCCGHEMEKVPLSVCRKDQAWAEHSRPMEEEKPCDDSRA